MRVLREFEFNLGVDKLDFNELKDDGLVVIWDKPSGPTSHDVVSEVRGMLIRQFEAPSYKKLGLKVGHAGTLDPLASGVLVILIGKATKVQSKFMGLEKEYVTEAVMGLVSDTYDVEGQIQEVSSKKLGVSRGTETHEVKIKIQEILDEKFTGVIQQRVPAFSAVKVGGKKLYEMARNGVIEDNMLPVKKVEIKSVVVEKVYVFSNAKILKHVQNDSILSSMDRPKAVRLRVVCGKGTYIRSLVHDMGQELGIGAVVVSLRRVRVGEFEVN